MSPERRGRYRSGQKAPTLAQSVEEARYQILYTFSTRIDEDRSISAMAEGSKRANQFLLAIFKMMQEKGITADNTIGNQMMRFSFEAPGLDQSLVSAAAYLGEAQMLQAAGDANGSWSALIQCYFHLGAFYGPKTATERAQEVAAKNRARYDDIKKQFVEWLSQLPDDYFDSLAKLKEWAIPRIKTYEQAPEKNKDGNVIESKATKVTFKSSKDESIGTLIDTWRKDEYDDRIDKAIIRVVKGEIGPGRKPDDLVTQAEKAAKRAKVRARQ